MFSLLYPWGLFALASLGGIVFLYFYVFRGRPIEVSALFLWQVSRSLEREGPQRKRPPLTLPLLLELLAALLMSLLVAGLTYYSESSHPHAVVLLDASASMNAGEGGETFRDGARETVMRLLDSL